MMFGNMTTSPPNVLLVVVDSLRARNVGTYGYHRETTPFLDSLAEESLLYEWAWSPAIWTLPSHVSFLTGLEVDEHGVDGPSKAIDSSEIVFDELRREYGYDTGIFSENTWLTEADMGIDGAFETVVGKPSVVFPEALRPGEFAHQNEYGQYVEYLKASLRSDHPVKSLANGLASKLQYDAPDSISQRFIPEPDGQYFVDQFLQWREQSDGPWAACINFMDAHRPYEPEPKHDLWDDGSARQIQSDLDDPVWSFLEGKEPTWKLRALEALYDGGIRQCDQYIEDIVEELKDADEFSDTLLIVLGDHGESFGEPAPETGGIAVEHKQGIHATQTHVPLLVNSPSEESGRVHQPVSLTETARVIEEVVEGSTVNFERQQQVLSVYDQMEARLVPWADGEGTLRFEAIVGDDSPGAVRHVRSPDIAEREHAERLPSAQCSFELEASGADFGDVFEQLTDKTTTRDAKIDDQAADRLEDLGYL